LSDENGIRHFVTATRLLVMNDVDRLRSPEVCWPGANIADLFVPD
jgi:hypothetical protein